MERKTTTAATLRWKILRQALLPPLQSGGQCQEVNQISRRTNHGFNLIPCQIVDSPRTNESTNYLSNLPNWDDSRDICFCYTLPTPASPKLFLLQRKDSCAGINDFEICNKYEIDNTGLVCHWPSEEVLAYYCVLHAEKFRSKRIIELGAGYGLAGLVIATITDASEVVISDGNPQVVEYIQRSISVNSGAFGDTSIKPIILHWDREEISTLYNTFDIIVASDCTFFKEYHEGLARIVNLLLKDSGPSEAIFCSPKRGNSLKKFLEKIKECGGLHYTLFENYDANVWERHQELKQGDASWPNYEEDHCYPVMVRITRYPQRWLSTLWRLSLLSLVGNSFHRTRQC